MVDQRPEAGLHSSGGISEPEAKSLCTVVYVKIWNMSALWITNLGMSFCRSKMEIMG